ncbi:MAG: DNA polymerase III subunit epsilon [Pseudomonadales bacterium]
MRQIVLDTETTGLDAGQGHRIIEIGCVELLDRKLTRRHYHQYINPERAIDEGAMEVHGITSEFLADKPLFADVWEEFREFVTGAELVIHNSAFDLGFIDAEMKRVSPRLGKISDVCSVIDSLAIARKKHPGQKNNLDALCKRYSVDNSQRDLHGALLDAEILADVYLLMTGGQVSLGLGADSAEDRQQQSSSLKRLSADRKPLRVIHASLDELQNHEEKLDQIDDSSGGSVWRRSETGVQDA